MRYLTFAIILLLTSCSQRTMMSIKARHHYNKDSASVLRVRERNPSIIANEFKRMIDNDEIKQKTVIFHDTIVLPPKTITEYLRPERVIDAKHEKYVKDSMTNVITSIAFAHNMSLDSANKKIFLILSSQKNCPELNGNYVITDGKTKKIARFEGGKIKEITVFSGDTVIKSTPIKQTFIKGNDTTTNYIPKWIWYVIGGLAAIIVTMYLFRKR